MIRQLQITFRKLREYRENERLSRAELEVRKLAKFRALVSHAVKHAPYYAKLVRERGIDVGNCGPADFPVLTKSLLLANFDAIATDRRITKEGIAKFLAASSDPMDRYLDEFQVIHTSGSSGEVGYFVFSKDDWFRGMAMRMRTRPKSTPFKRLKVMFYGAVDGHYAGVSMASLGKRGINKLIARIETCEINSPLPDVIRRLNAYQPELLVGYATALKILAQKQQEGLLSIAPRRIEVGGETVTENDRAVLARAFGAEVYNVYACSEHLMMGFSPPGSTTMQLLDDDLIYECRDDHVLTTNLFNFTLPLIRYRMSDVLRLLPQQDRSSPYLFIDNLVGRTELTPTFVNRDGVEDFISPHTINEIFVPGVARFQLRVQSKARFRFCACLDPAVGADESTRVKTALASRLREILAAKSMHNVGFEVEVVDDLPLNPRTRKFNLIVDESQQEGVVG